jgi:predicted DNA-binding transcriptional regulator AlpA
MSEELLRPRDVAKIFGISVKTLWKWQKKGEQGSPKEPSMS